MRAEPTQFQLSVTNTIRAIGRQNDRSEYPHCRKKLVLKHFTVAVGDSPMDIAGISPSTRVDFPRGEL